MDRKGHGIMLGKIKLGQMAAPVALHGLLTGMDDADSLAFGQAAGVHKH